MVKTVGNLKTVFSKCKNLDNQKTECITIL